MAVYVWWYKQEIQAFIVHIVLVKEFTNWYDTEVGMA